MIKHYKFSNINESETDIDRNVSGDAIDAAVEHGLGKPDSTEIKHTSFGLYVILNYKLKNNKIDIYVYSCNNENIINDVPLCKIFNPTYDCDYFIVEKYINRESSFNDDTVSNFLDDNGFALDEWYDDISMESNDGYHIAYSDGGYNIVNADGYEAFKEPKKGEQFGNYILTKNKYGVGYSVYDYHGRVVLDKLYNIYSCCMLYNEDKDIEEYYYFVSFYGKNCIYDANMNLISDDISDVEDGDDFCLIRSDNVYNIIVPGGKLLFGDDPYDKSEWFDRIEESPHFDKVNLRIIERDGKYNLFDPETLTVKFNEWVDGIKFIQLTYIDIYYAAVIKKNDKFNIYVLDSNNDNYNEFLFNEPVDNIAEYNDLILVKKDNIEYIVWKNSKFLHVECYNICQTEYENTYIIKIGDKFDLISTEEDETFCEKYMNGNKFDDCFDLNEYHPIVKYKGKYGYIDIYNFKPVFEDENGNMRWFDDADSCIYDDGEDIFIFPVVINGEKVMLDEDGNEIDDRDEDE